MGFFFTIFCLVLGFVFTFAGVYYGYRYNTSCYWSYKYNPDVGWYLIALGFVCMLIACGIGIIG